MNKLRLLKYFILFAGLLSLAVSGFAEVRLPAIISSNMVLQRNTTVHLWGWADPQEKISITPSWLNQELKVAADAQGNWRIDLKTTDSKDPQSIDIRSDASEILLENILFGEVWLCSGQSNMEHALQGKYGQPTGGSQEAIVHAQNSNLRLFTVHKQADTLPRDAIEKFTGWESANPATVSEFSAIAYFFGQELQEILDVPVGMIHSSWGGSSVRAWMSKEALSAIEEVDLSKADLNRAPGTPTVIFNAMIHPLVSFTIRGALWYQGERNVWESEKYKVLFPAMVQDWRNRWGIGDFPFYYVQIAPYAYENPKKGPMQHVAAQMRDAQMECLDLIPNSGIAVTLDIGEEHVIHPARKKEVAERLLYNALNKTYGYEAVDCSGPVYDSFEIRNDTVLVRFRNAENGLFVFDQLTGFEIAGKDKVFYPAQAELGMRGVIAKSKRVKKPVALRYGWKNWVKGTLLDTNMLPASSFRTDDWSQN